MMRRRLALPASFPKDVSVKAARPRLFGVTFVCLIAAAATANENWPQWRGPTANGISDSKNLPTTWNAERGENIVWKTELPAWSGSTPIVWGDSIFLTSPSKSDGSASPQESAGKRPPDGKGFGDKGFGGKGGFGG